MDLDFDACLRAVTSRDRRFEGRFVLGVTSTGLYCRPGCPARLPRRDHCRFFTCPAAAAEAGFRPCARCRPDRSPRVRYAGTSATVSRALRCIDLGELDGRRGGIEALADRLGVSGRHLRRLFAEHMGASPLQVALTRRLHFARRLLEETRLPVTQVAEAAGFASLRRFHGAMRDTFRRPPRELRRSRGAEAPAGIEIRLPAKAPFPWDGVLAYLRGRAIPGVEEVRDGVYRRSVCLAGAAGTIEARLDGREPGIVSRLDGLPPAALLPAVERLRRLFDLDADPAPIAAHLGSDPLLVPALARMPGRRVPGAWDGFELAVRAVLGQQVSVKGATTIAGRLVARWGRELPGGPRGTLTHLFPSPEALAAANLEGLGVPRSRAATLGRLAEAVASGRIALDGSMDPADVTERLVAIPGIGPWTAAYVAMRALREPDAFPATDLGVRQALARRGVDVTPARIEARAERWRPWRAYATLLLWSTLDPHRAPAAPAEPPSRGTRQGSPPPARPARTTSPHRSQRKETGP